jgi:twinkle protein
MKVTIFKNVTDSQTPYYVELATIYERIKTGKYKKQIEEIRGIPEKKNRDVLKNKLPSICFSGIFSKRGNDFIKEHSGLVAVDFDHLPDYDAFWQRIIKDQYTHMAFRSPSGDGVKVIVKIPSSIENHRKSCRSLQDYYKSDHLDQFEDEARVCFISYDPDIFWNKGSVEFTKLKELKEEKEKQKNQTVTEAVSDPDEIYKRIKVWLEKTDHYVNGNKYKFLVKLSGACCRFGIPVHIACMRMIIDYKNAADPVDPKDFEKICENVYKTYSNTYCSAVFTKDVPVDRKTGENVEKQIHSQEIQIVDIIRIQDIRESMLDGFKNGYQRGETTYFPDIDEHWSWKKGEVTLMGGIMNHGKTTMIMQLCLIKSVKDGYKWGFFSPEQNPPNEFFNDLVHMYIGKNTEKHFNNRMSETEYKRGLDFINEHFFYVYPKDVKPTPDYINKKFTELIVKHGISGCVTDPFNQLDNDWVRHGRDDLYISEYLSKEKRFALDHKVYKIIIAHPKSMGAKKSDGNYECPNVFDFSGGAMWGAKVDNILQTYRPLYSTDGTNTVTEFISQKIKKQKLVGLPGKTVLDYRRDTGRYYTDNFNPLEHEVQKKMELEPNTNFYERDCPF